MATAEPRPNVLALTRAVAIQSVRFVRTTTEFLGFREGDVLDKIKVFTKAGGSLSPDDPQGIRAVVVLECSVWTTDLSRSAGKVTCEVALDYKVSDPGLLGRLSEEDYTQFGATTGLYNAWPFIREFCHSATLRMGLPTPAMLPSVPVVLHPAVPQQAEAPRQH